MVSSTQSNSLLRWELENSFTVHYINNKITVERLYFSVFKLNVLHRVICLRYVVIEYFSVKHWCLKYIWTWNLPNNFNSDVNGVFSSFSVVSPTYNSTGVPFTRKVFFMQSDSYRILGKFYKVIFNTWFIKWKSAFILSY